MFNYLQIYLLNILIDMFFQPKHQQIDNYHKEKRIISPQYLQNITNQQDKCLRKFEFNY